MGSTVKFVTVSQFGLLSSEYRLCFSVRGGGILGDRKVAKLRGNVGGICKMFTAGKQEKIGFLRNPGKIFPKAGFVGNVVPEKLDPLWDDGYGDQSVKDYLELSKDMIKPDYGPPRWFCPTECGCPLKDSPVLLFLPGIDGLGMGLLLHHKALGKVFEVRCMHIPVYDRTPYEGLVNFVENAVRLEHASASNKPIYLVAESLGGCLALSVAARNPTIDLVIILINPATSFGRSQLQPLFHFLEALPDQLHGPLSYLLSFSLGDTIKMAMTHIRGYSRAKNPENILGNLTGFLPYLSRLADIITKDTFTWKLKLLKSAAAHANSRLRAVKAEVLLIASGNDKLLPSGEEARLLSNTIDNCKVRYFKDNNHMFLLEDGANLLTIIKGTCMYRRKSKRDYISDFLPPSMSEFHFHFDELLGLFRLATSPVMFSTLEDGKIVRGLKGVPNKGPVLLVGYHMLFGTEVCSLFEEFLREKNLMLYGVAHPALFMRKFETPSNEFSNFDRLKVFGAVPASGSSLYKLLSNQSHVLLYPGGVREALHLKTEKYKPLWPDQPEFVRMAIRFGARIVPFGVVGEDDFAELFLDYNDIAKIPILKSLIKQQTPDPMIMRGGKEVTKENVFVPFFYPKLPGRFYFLFGKPIETKGRQECLTDGQLAKQFYQHIKSEIENCTSYLLEKREEDPYRNIFDRIAYRAISAPANRVPSFDP